MERKNLIKAGDEELRKFLSENRDKKIIFPNGYARKAVVVERDANEGDVLKHFASAYNKYSEAGLTESEIWKQIGESILEKGPSSIFAVCPYDKKNILAASEYYNKSNPSQNEKEKFSLKLAKKLCGLEYYFPDDVNCVCKDAGLERKARELFIETADEIVGHTESYRWYGEKAVSHIFNLYTKAGLTKDECAKHLFERETKEFKDIEEDIKYRKSLEGSVYDSQLKHIEEDSGREEFLRITKWLKEQDLELAEIYKDKRKKNINIFFEGVMKLYNRNGNNNSGGKE